MSFFAFLTRFKTHLYAAFALRTALILYGDYQVCAELFVLGIWAVSLKNFNILFIMIKEKTSITFSISL